MKKEKLKISRNQIIIAIIFLVLVLFGAILGMYFENKDKTTDKVDNKDKVEKDLPDINGIIDDGNIINENESKDLDEDKTAQTIINLDKCMQGVKCVRYLKVNTEVVKIDYEDNDTWKTLKINDKEVASGFNISNIESLDDVIFFSVSGTDIRTTTIYGYTTKGDSILTLYDLDVNYTDMVVLEAPFIIENKILKVSGSRLNHGLELNNGTKICDEESLKLNGLTKDEIIEAMYEVEYLGKGKFSPLKMTSSTTIANGKFCK